MSWATTALKTALSKIVPQYWNSATSDWEPVEGSNGAYKTQVVDSAGAEAFTAANPGNMQLTGSVPEYGWKTGDAEPAPTGFALGMEVDPATDIGTVKYWNGVTWEVLV